MIELSADVWVFAIAVALVAGVIKGIVGFAMPMVMISGLATVLPPELALAALIMPTCATNLWQALRGGVRAVRASIRYHWRFLAVILLCIAGAAQLVSLLSQSAMFLILGIPVSIFAVLQLLGWRLHFAAERRRIAEFCTALIAGVIGGISGVWGPPTVLYLTALNTEKAEQMRVQGVVYGSGAVVLLVAHLKSGILNAQTLPFSVLLLIPALLGMWAGFRVQDRIDQTLFRRLTLAVLVIAGLNLVRRGLMA